MKGAAGRRIERIGERKAEPSIGNAETGFRREHGIKQRPRIGMTRVQEDRLTDGGRIGLGTSPCNTIRWRFRVGSGIGTADSSASV